MLCHFCQVFQVFYLLFQFDRSVFIKKLLKNHDVHVHYDILIRYTQDTDV